LVAEDTLQDLISRAKKQGFKHDLSSLWFISLIDNFEDSQIGDLVSTKVHKMRNKTRSKNGPTPGEITGVE
jgi:hypothetical protein